jgi:hypothetical protein
MAQKLDIAFWSYDRTRLLADMSGMKAMQRYGYSIPLG